MASIFDNKFCIPLDFEILESGFPFYQCGSGIRLTYQLTFTDNSDVIKASNPDASYMIFNISLESACKLFCYLCTFQDAQINISDAQFLNVVY